MVFHFGLETCDGMKEAKAKGETVTVVVTLTHSYR